MASRETCSRCGEEVRWGWRHGRQSYWHREDVDHEPVFGYIMSDEDWAAIEAEMDRPRVRTVTKSKTVKGEKITWDEEQEYTTRELSLETYRKSAKYRAAEALEAEDDEEEDEGHELEPIEVHRTPMPHKGVLRVDTPDGPREVPVPGGTRTLLNLAEKQGWEVIDLTYSRGPYLGASGKSLGVSDYVVLRLRGPVVDGSPILGIASWRDGKSDWAYRVENKTMSRVGARALSAWMKENPWPRPETS